MLCQAHAELPAAGMVGEESYRSSAVLPASHLAVLQNWSWYAPTAAAVAAAVVFGQAELPPDVGDVDTWPMVASTRLAHRTSSHCPSAKRVKVCTV